MRLGGSSAQDLLAIQDLTQMCADLEDLICGPIHERVRAIERMCSERRTQLEIGMWLDRLDEWMLAAVDRIEDGGSA